MASLANAIASGTNATSSAVIASGDASGVRLNNYATKEKPTTSDKKELKQSILSEANAMNKMEGKDEKGDIRVQTMKKAMESLVSLIPEDGGKDGKFKYASMHLGSDIGPCVGKTRDDVHRAFLLWSQKEKDRENDSFNVTKAFRRLEAFADYQLRMYEPYFNTPVDITSKAIIKASQFLNIKTLADTCDGAVVIIIDLAKLDYEGLDNKDYDMKDFLRYYWAYMLNTMFDDAACSQGSIIIEGLGGCGISDMYKMNRIMKPIENDMNEMFYGVMPYKMKMVILVGTPWWLSALIRFMRLFLSKKMSSRIKNLYMKDMYKIIGGADRLPLGYLGGTKEYVERYARLPLEKGNNDGEKKEAADETEEEEEEDITF